jgi:hypothetical protein
LERVEVRAVVNEVAKVLANVGGKGVESDVENE